MKNGEYILIAPPNDYPGKLYREKYAYEHHVVWWQNTGELVPSGKLIHHKNENKTDNRCSNFEILSVNDHVKLHAKPKKMVKLICAFCGTAFEREARNVSFKMKSGQKDFYCGRSCMSSHFGGGRKKAS